VAIAPDGNRALNAGMEDDIELVILDVHMPMYDGVEVLAMLRERHLMRPVKVLALTGDDSAEVRSAMESKGIDGFLTKPVDLTTLRETVARLMAGQGPGELGLYRRARERRLGR
jgi:CheY-like chemotaxis protein